MSSKGSPKFDSSVGLVREDSYDLALVPDILKQCPENAHTSVTILGSYDGWAVALQCLECNHKWYVCRFCKNARRHLYTRTQLSNHKSGQHGKKTTENITHKKRKTVMPLELTQSLDFLASISEKAQLMQCETPQMAHFLNDFTANASGVATMSDRFLYETDAPLGVDDEYDDNESVMAEDDNESVMAEDERPSVPESAKELPSAARMLGDSSILLADIHTTESLGFSDIKSERYFKNSSLRYAGETGNYAGMAYLVLQSHIQTLLEPQDLFQMRCELKKSNVILEMQIAELTILMSRREREKYAYVLAGTYFIGCEDGYINGTNSVNCNFNKKYPLSELGKDFVKRELVDPYDNSHIVERATRFSTTIPCTVNDMNMYYIRNKFSIMENIPHPPIFSDIEGHAYVSIIDCIRDALGHCSGRVDCILSPGDLSSTGEDDPKIFALRSCQKAKEILRVAQDIPGEKGKSDRLISYIIFWNDDCDPNSAAMQGRANVWLKSMTIAQPLDDRNRIENTYPIACGDKALSHNLIEARINDDIIKLTTGRVAPFYVGALNKKVKATFGHMANLADQPERRSANHLSAGNSTYHCRTFVSANHFKLYERGVLKSCNDCYVKLVKTSQEKDWMTPLPKCKKCLNWDVLDHSFENALLPLPDGYPDPLTLDNYFHSRVVGAGSLTPRLSTFRITYESLRHAVALSHKRYCDSTWSKRNCKTFLNVEGLHDAFIQEFQLYADRVKALALAEGHVLDELREDQQLNPSAYEQIPYPASWMRVGQSTEDTIDALMHLLFLGVVGTCIDKIQVSIKVKERNKDFIDCASRYQKSLLTKTIAWMKLRAYSGGKFYGWNSENYLAFSRLMPWFYQNYEEFPAKKDANRHAPPANKPQKQWTVDENRYWLKIRNLNSVGKKADLVSRVQEYMQQVPVPEPVPIPVVEPDLVQKVVVSLQDMLECVMSPGVDNTTIKQAEYTVRIFLSNFDTLDNLLREDRAKPSCISSYNFMCLMNLPRAMARFGPLRELWEGKFQGEGILLHVKSEMTQGKRKNWQGNLMKNVLRTKAFQNILHSKEKPVIDPCSKEFLSRYQDQLHKYKSASEVDDCIYETDRDQKSVVSVLLVRQMIGVISSTRMFSVTHDYNTIVEIISDFNDEDDAIVKFGLTYYTFSLRKANGEPILIQWNEEVAPSLDPAHTGVSGAMLLPLLDPENSEHKRKFALISSNWKKLSRSTRLWELVEEN